MCFKISAFCDIFAENLLQCYQLTRLLLKLASFSKEHRYEFTWKPSLIILNSIKCTYHSYFWVRFFFSKSNPLLIRMNFLRCIKLHFKLLSNFDRDFWEIISLWSFFLWLMDSQNIWKCNRHFSKYFLISLRLNMKR